MADGDQTTGQVPVTPGPYATPPATSRPEPRGLGAAVNDVQTDARAFIAAEISLLTAEVSTKVRKIGIAGAFGAAAGVIALYALGFLLVTLRDVFDLFIPLWVADLVTAVLLLVVVGALALLARRLIGQGVPPTPNQAIGEARTAVAALKEGDR